MSAAFPPPPRPRTASRHDERAARDLVRDLGRDVVDHGLRRRATLAAVGRATMSAWDVCDAHPHLLTAARHYGVAVARPCPICRRPGLAEVHFVYGEALRHVAGQAKSPAEVRRLATASGRVTRRFDVYVVEVCGQCRWNHLLRSFVVGDGETSSAGVPDRVVADG